MRVESLEYNNITDSRRGPDPAAPECLIPPPFLTVQDVARALQVEETNILALLERGELPFVNVSGCEVRIHREGLEDWRFPQEMGNFKPTR